MNTLDISTAEAERFLEVGPNILAECDRITNNSTADRIILPSVEETSLLSQLDEVDRGDAHSYRNFLVAAGFLAFDWDGRSGLYVKGNYKVEGKEKSCAEWNAEAALRKKGFHKAAGVIVQGTSDTGLIHAVTGIATPTLHPCPDKCQPMLKNSPVIPADMPIVTIADDGSRFQAFILSDLFNYYEQDNIDAVTNYNIGGRINFFKALIHYKRIMRQAERWRNPPGPSEVVVTSLLETSED